MDVLPSKRAQSAASFDPSMIAYRSDTAQRRKADVFIWFNESGVWQILACFNAQRTTLTSQTVLKWLKAVKPLLDELVIRHVWLDRVCVDGWIVRPLDDSESGVVPPSDTLLAGEYGCFKVASSEYRPRFQGVGTAPLSQLQDTYFWAVGTPECSITDELCQGLKIPHDECIFTGSARVTRSSPHATVDICWIFPYYLRLKITTGTRRDGYDTEDLDWISSDNLLPMRSDVYSLWLDNAFSVDVDDGCRIHVFDESAAKLRLPERLSKVEQRWVPFLREHHYHTIVVQILGGDIHDFGEPLAGKLCDFENEYMDPETSVDLSEEVWETELGRDIKEWKFSKGWWDRNATIQFD